MKRIFTLGLALTLLTSLPAISAVKAGSACKKVGQITTVNSKQYTCIKSGKKTIWNKGKTIKTAAPTPTPIPSSSPSPTPTTLVFKPWDTQFDSVELYKKALANTASFFGILNKTEENLNIIMQDTFVPSDATFLRSLGVGVHSYFYPITKQPTVLIFATAPQWAGEKAQALNLSVNSVALPCGGNGTWDSYCSNNNAGFMIYNGRFTEAKNRNLASINFGTGATAVVAHEYFHTVQSALINREARNPASPLYIPTWLFEGSANFVGMAITEFQLSDIYSSGRRSEVEAHQDYKRKETQVSLEKFQQNNSMNEGVALNPYGIGMAATEYIVASVGFQAFLNIFSYTRDSKNFAESFEKAVGISLTKFYDLFDAARPSLEIGTK